MKSKKIDFLEQLIEDQKNRIRPLIKKKNLETMKQLAKACWEASDKISRSYKIMAIAICEILEEKYGLKEATIIRNHK